MAQAKERTMLHYHGTEEKMEARMTGGGGLSRKILTVLLVCSSVTSWAVDNSIYIDQSGDNAVITMTQDGAGNRVKGISSSGNPGQDVDPAKIYGDSVMVAISQVGSGNSLALGINSNVVSGRSATVNYSVTGGNNQGLIDLNNVGTTGGNSNSLVDISQTDGDNVTRISMLGTGNTINATQAGGGATYSSIVNAVGTTQNIATQGGTANSVTTNLTGDNGLVTIAAQGASNTISVTQSGGGSLGHTTDISVNGSGNTVTTTQSGSIDTAIGIRSVGSGNNFNISTHN
jgi:hypothetical protein